MYISTDSDRRSNRCGISLLREYIFGFVSNKFDLFFSDAFECFQIFDDSI